MALTLRNDKGSALTYVELDGNFVYLDGRITSVNSSLTTNITNVSSSIVNTITNNSSSFSTSITNLSSSTAASYTSLSSSVASDTTDLTAISSSVVVISSSYAPLSSSYSQLSRSLSVNVANVITTGSATAFQSITGSLRISSSFRVVGKLETTGSIFATNYIGTSAYGGIGPALDAGYNTTSEIYNQTATKVPAFPFMFDNSDRISSATVGGVQYVFTDIGIGYPGLNSIGALISPAVYFSKTAASTAPYPKYMTVISDNTTVTLADVNNGIYTTNGRNHTLTVTGSFLSLDGVSLGTRLSDTHHITGSTRFTGSMYINGLVAPSTIITTPSVLIVSSSGQIFITSSVSSGTTIDTGSFVSTSSFNSYTGSAVTTSSFNAFTSSVTTTSSFNLFTSSVVTTSSFNVFTGSVITTGSIGRTQSITGSLRMSGSYDIRPNFATANMAQLTAINTSAGQSFGALILREDSDGSGFIATLKTDNITADRTVSLPNATGTLLMTINNQGGDANGNITISAGTGGAFTGSFIATGSISASVNLGTASFQITSGSSRFMFVSNSGYVGIGTTSSLDRLQIYGDIALRSGSNTNTNYGMIKFGTDDPTNLTHYAGIASSGYSSGNPAKANLMFITDGSDGPSEKMRIYGNGSLLLGNTGSTDFKIMVDASGLGGAGSALQIKTDTSGNSNTQGSGSHIMLDNNNSSGQNSITSYISGSFISKIRSSYEKHINYIVSGSGGHYFWTGGDTDTGGLVRLYISGSGNVAIGNGLVTPRQTLTISGSLGILGLTTGSTNNLTNVLMVSSSGQVFITASSAIGGGGSTDISGLLTTSSFNAFTSSVVTTSSFNSFTGSVITTGSISIRQSITGSLNLTGSANFTGSFGINGNVYVTASVSRSAALILESSGSDNPIFIVRGSQGELFSVSDTLTGSLFSVNDISGLPILDVNSDQTVKIGSFLAPGTYASARITANSGSNIIYSLPTSSYEGVWYDYTIRSGSTARVGTIMAMWNGSQVNYTEVTASSFGNTPFTMSVSIFQSNMVLSGSTSSNNWTIKTIIRAI